MLRPPENCEVDSNLMELYERQAQALRDAIALRGVVMPFREIEALAPDLPLWGTNQVFATAREETQTQG